MPGTSSILPILAVPPRLIRKSAIMYAWEISSFDCFFSQLPKPLKPSFSQKKDMAIYKLADHISAVICSLIAFSSFFEIVMTIIVFRCFYIFFSLKANQKELNSAVLQTGCSSWHPPPNKKFTYQIPCKRAFCLPERPLPARMARNNGQIPWLSRLIPARR